MPPLWDRQETGAATPFLAGTLFADHETHLRPRSLPVSPMAEVESSNTPISQQMSDHSSMAGPQPGPNIALLATVLLEDSRAEGSSGLRRI